VTDADCVAFLQWALPQLGLRWAGYRKVRRQVCRRIGRRLAALGIPDLATYRARLVAWPEEWGPLDALCCISISRFYRDRAVFDVLRDHVLPVLAEAATGSGAAEVRAWSAGCCSGEEPFTLRLLWDLGLSWHRPPLTIVATDVDAQLLARAEAACYPWSSLRGLPGTWIERAFRAEGGEYCLQPAFCRGVRFARQDLREEAPEGLFHLILCRNLAFTYFTGDLQRQAAERLARHLKPGGALVLGSHELLPAGNFPLFPWFEALRIYRRS
jgi:chemotaxis protein methyltransferase CheR